MSNSGFTLCEYDGRKAVRFHHEFGEFDFFIVQAEDGSNNVSFMSNVSSLRPHILNKIGDIAMSRIRSTARALHYPVSTSPLTFGDLLNIMAEAETFLQKTRAQR